MKISPATRKPTSAAGLQRDTLGVHQRSKKRWRRFPMGALTRYPEREPMEEMVAAHLGLKANRWR